MVKSPEDFVAGIVLAVLFCPALFGLAHAIFKVKRGKVETGNDNFRSGLRMHVINAFISPCIPAYLLYVDIRTGGGSMASILSFPLIPLTWVLFFIGKKRIDRAAAAAP